MKQRFFLNFPPETHSKPITYELIKKFDIRVNIINANISQDEEGYLLIDMEADETQITDACNFLENNGIGCMPAEKRIIFESDKCVHCGACTAVCFAGALTIDPAVGKLLFGPGKCVACGLCATACPLKLFSINFGMR